MAALMRMGFEDFANAVRPTGAVNRWPQLGDAEEVVTYSVYLNGPVAQQLAQTSQDHEYKDVMLHALTEKLGLNPQSPRDNLKVAELVSIRGAWMSAILDSSMERDKTGQIVALPDAVVIDYEKLAEENGLSHPWIQSQIEAQKRLSMGLTPALSAASAVVGKPVHDRVPDEVSHGVVLSRNADFTVQATNAGEIVTHENRRLGTLPEVGQEVLVSYYRGQGQVVYDRERLTVSEPYIDNKTLDIAVNLTDKTGKVQEVVLFNSVNSFAKFVAVEGLDTKMVVKAMDAREATPKRGATIPSIRRELASDIYIDNSSGCLAVDYMEGNMPYTTLFGSVEAMQEHGQEFGFSPDQITNARKLERETRLTGAHVQASRAEAQKFVEDNILDEVIVDLTRSTYIGSVIKETPLHVVQNLGRVVAIHDIRDLDKVPKVGDKLEVNYQNYRGKVAVTERGQNRSVER